MKLLGHRNINNTLLYTQLANFESDEYHSAVAQSIEEARELIEQDLNTLHSRGHNALEETEMTASRYILERQNGNGQNRTVKIISFGFHGSISEG